MDGFGSIEPEKDEPIFHEEWEKRVFGLLNATLAFGAWNLDEIRHAIERMFPADYLTTTYYEHWLHALETLSVEKSVVSREELRNGRADRETVGGTVPELTVADVPGFTRTGASARLDVEVGPSFLVGDQVSAKNIHPLGHTRLPRYVRGRRGVIERDYGVFVFPDTHASGGEAKPQHLYNVRFTHRELFGTNLAEGSTVALDLWDDYLEI